MKGIWVCLLKIQYLEGGREEGRSFLGCTRLTCSVNTLVTLCLGSWMGEGGRGRNTEPAVFWEARTPASSFTYRRNLYILDPSPCWFSSCWGAPVRQTAKGLCPSLSSCLWGSCGSDSWWSIYRSPSSVASPQLLRCTSWFLSSSSCFSWRSQHTLIHFQFSK